MPWTRTAALLTSFGLTLACTRANPAFDDDLGGGSESLGESDATSAGEGTSTTTQDGSTTLQDESTTMQDESTTEDPNACGRTLREGLQLRFADPFLLGGSCPDLLELNGRLVYDPVLQSMTLSRCEADDLLCQGECGSELHPVVVDFDISGLANSCVSVQAYKPIDSQGDLCSWGSLSMFLGGATDTPLAIAITKGIEPPPHAKLVLAGHPMLEEVEACKCAAFGIDDPCCVDEDGLHFYDFVLPDLSHVAPGESAEFEIPAVPFSYKFLAVQAEQIGVCSTFAKVETSWAMWASL